MTTTKPSCPECESELTCPVCTAEKDPRPTAEEVYMCGRIRSPFGRWETITRVEQVDRYGPVQVWTEEAGPDFCWRYNRWDKVDFVPPPPSEATPAPEVRVVEWEGHDGYMYVLAIGDGRSYGWVPPSSSVLAESRSAGRGKGWWVSTHYQSADGKPMQFEFPSKAKARTKMNEIARAYAKLLKVKVNHVKR
jgi:hypothetical protein